MKTKIGFLMAMLGFVLVTGAQERNNSYKQPTAKQKQKTVPNNVQASADTVSLTSISSNEAYDAAAGNRFTIADPTINALKLQAFGESPIVSPSGIVGMPRRAYGFSNGKILLRPTTSRSSGTLYGSGAVGTGTSMMGVGTGERAVGVNGKNPAFGTSLWGSKSPVRNLPPSYRNTPDTPKQ
jgi:hypothetical protein